MVELNFQVQPKRMTVISTIAQVVAGGVREAGDVTALPSHAQVVTELRVGDSPLAEEPRAEVVDAAVVEVQSCTNSLILLWS